MGSVIILSVGYIANMFACVVVYVDKKWWEDMYKTDFRISWIFIYIVIVWSILNYDAK